MSAGAAPEGGNFPIAARLVLAKDVHIAVSGIDLETALRWREPAINRGVHSEPALPQPERKGLLFAAISGIALYANRHALTIPLDVGRRTDLSTRTNRMAAAIP